MNVRLVAAAFALTTAVPAIAEDVYVIDPVHSQPQWEATHIGFSKQHGNFGMTTGVNIGNPGDEVKLTLPVEAYLEQPQG